MAGRNVGRGPKAQDPREVAQARAAQAAAEAARRQQQEQEAARRRADNEAAAQSRAGAQQQQAMVQAAQQAALGGGEGGGAPAAAPAPAPEPAPAPPVIERPTVNLEDYIKSNFLVQQQRGEAERLTNDFDAETLRGRQETTAAQGLRSSDLTRKLGVLGQNSAEDLAGRGLLRSGINFQQQDKINAEGVVQRSAIDQLMTDFNTKRISGRANLQASARARENEAIQAAMQSYAATFGVK
jgi:hypothetical protein